MTGTLTLFQNDPRLTTFVETGRQTLHRLNDKTSTVSCCSVRRRPTTSAVPYPFSIELYRKTHNYSYNTIIFHFQIERFEY